MTKIRLSYQTVEFGSVDIHLCTLRDKQEFHDPMGIAENLGICSASWPMFGVLWPSSLALAHIISTYKTESKRMLEVGCGMALSMPSIKQTVCKYYCNGLSPRSPKVFNTKHTTQ